MPGKLKFGYDTILQQSSINVLGVEVNCRLRFDDHLEKVAHNASQEVTLLSPQPVRQGTEAGRTPNQRRSSRVTISTAT